jgi:hypothetical protein
LVVDPKRAALMVECRQVVWLSGPFVASDSPLPVKIEFQIIAAMHGLACQVVPRFAGQWSSKLLFESID